MYIYYWSKGCYSYLVIVIVVQDKTAFAEILKRISKIQKSNGSNYVVLRDK